MAEQAPTPMMTQYRELKQQYPDFMLLFRLGDFYELFLEDAERGAKILSITLTSRQGAPMAGIPHHAAESYIARLIHAGQKVAICEQMEAPGKGKKLLRRKVVRVVTPGTVTDTAYLAGGTNNFLLAVVRAREGTGVALVDVSTGEFWAGEDTGTAAGAVGTDDGVLAAALLRRPSEIVLPESLRETTDLLARLAATGATLSFTDGASFGGRRAGAELCAQFGVTSLEPFGVGDLTVGLQAAAGALGYLRATQGDALGHLTRLQRLHTGDALARRHGGRDARADRGEWRRRARLALRRAGRDRDADGRPPAAPVDAAAASRPGRDPRAAGRDRRALRGARGA